MPISLKLDRKTVTVELNARRTLEGDIIITDHEDMDIILLKEKNKCLTFPKESMSDKVYSAQDRLYKFLSKRGVIDRSSVRGGNIYGSLEAKILQSKIPGINNIQATIFSLYEYIKDEKPYFGNLDRISNDYLDHVLSPDSDFSTELGEIPQGPNKGANDPKVRPYGYMYNYSLMREEKESED